MADAVPEHQVLFIMTHRPDTSPPFGERPYFSRIDLRAFPSGKAPRRGGVLASRDFLRSSPT